ncbi:hypothetical protein OIU34_19530 [Pararhizobium sp. BT-229]|uniref:hypothetical protein n=1 Tax=Pararhizobium sp. BT-229 TaxID=2986923 RepID=UPI0021F6F420|nr:hypothetical protein [Pararhizobium sp. BT-229]MCV9964076.1 hypothetical protein [Pararhizobium sp. BT-229]
MSKFTVCIFASAVSFIALAGSAQAAGKCYEDVWVEAKLECAGSDSKSADFTTGCKVVAAHMEKQEISCPVGKWVNVTAETKVGTSGKVVTLAQVCATAGMVPYNINGKVCASGERPARAGNGWESIVYKYGLKGGGNGNDGGDKLQAVNSGSSSILKSARGTMCYDYNMGAKNDTKQDAVIAVYCK